VLDDLAQQLDRRAWRLVEREQHLEPDRGEEREHWEAAAGAHENEFVDELRVVERDRAESRRRWR
jgi:hypothetical protein